MSGNLLPRVGAAIVFLPFLVWATLRGGVVFLLLVEAVLLLGTREVIVLTARLGLRPAPWVAYPAVAALPLVAGAGADAALLLILAAAGAVLIAGVLARTARPIHAALAGTILAITGPGLFGAFLSILRAAGAGPGPGATAPLPVEGATAVFLLFLTTWSCDTAAYFGGRALGRHKMAPVLSPKKTWEGAAFGLAAAVASGWLASVTFARALDPLVAAAIGAAMGTCGQVGDLAESALKREANAKDAGALIPGHGGVLDRFDSLLFNAPVLYALLRLM